MEWQPIETAPMAEDYNEILAFNGDFVGSAVLFEGRWLDHFHDFFDPQPTHWMALPDAPKDTNHDR